MVTRKIQVQLQYVDIGNASGCEQYTVSIYRNNLSEGIPVVPFALIVWRVTSFVGAANAEPARTAAAAILVNPLILICQD